MPKTLLLADDSVVIQKLVGLSFANEDVELITTDNGDDAVAKARELKPDVVLADVVMPGMSGYEVCQSIKSDPNLCNTPVLLLTGTFEAFDEERARQAGSDGHITKPFEAQVLVDRVAELLAQVQSQGMAATAPKADDSFDFFDDGVTNLAGELGLDVTNVSPAAAIPAAAPTSQPAPAAPPAPMPAPIPPRQPAAATSTAQTPIIGTDLSDGVGDSEPSFAFGVSEDAALPPLDDSELLGAPLDDVMSTPDAGDDHTVALMPDGLAGGASAPLHSAQEAPTVTSLAIDTPGSAPQEEFLSPVHDLDASEPRSDVQPSTPAAAPEMMSQPAGIDLSDAGAPLAAQPEPAATPDTFAQARDSAGAPDPSLTTIIMSGGDPPSDGIELGDSRSPVVSLDESPAGAPADPAEVSYDGPPATSYNTSSFGAGIPSATTRDTPPTIHAPPEPAVVDPLAAASVSPVGATPDSGPALDLPATPNPAETILADELFAERSPFDPVGPSAEVSTEAPAGSDDIFDFGASDPLAGASSDLLDDRPANSSAPAVAGDYDVSSSDLGDSFLETGPADTPAVTPGGVDPVAAVPSAPDDDDLIAQDVTPWSADADVAISSDPSGQPDPVSPLTSDPLAPQGDDGSPARALPDITPVMRDRIHETLERVAWEAFGDVSESLVKALLERVEAVAWEVIPQMAEALIKDEIRRMKGEDE